MSTEFYLALVVSMLIPVLVINATLMVIVIRLLQGTNAWLSKTWWNAKFAREAAELRPSGEG